MLRSSPTSQFTTKCTYHPCLRLALSQSWITRRGIRLTLCSCCVERFPCPQQGPRGAFPRCAWWEEHKALDCLAFAHRSSSSWPCQSILADQNLTMPLSIEYVFCVWIHTLCKFKYLCAKKHWISKICNPGSLILCMSWGLRRRHNHASYCPDHLLIRTKKGNEPRRTIRCPC